MKILGKFFSKSAKKEDPEDTLRIARIIGPLIDNIVMEIFASYKTNLLSEPITYIVPAVWGATKNGELTAAQKEINKQLVAPVIEKIFDSLQLEGLNSSQEFSIGFLIRGLIIAKLSYVIDGAKNRIINKNVSREKDSDLLDDLEPLGTA